MTVARASVIDGLYTRLTGDSTFNTAIGGTASIAGRLRHGIADEDQTVPYVAFIVVDDTAPFEFVKDGYEMRIQFSVYESETSGARACMVILDKLVARLQRNAFAVSGHNNIKAELDVTRGPFKDDQLWRMDADFIVSGFET